MCWCECVLVEVYGVVGADKGVNEGVSDVIQTFVVVLFRFVSTWRRLRWRCVLKYHPRMILRR